jgi:hypothetical protein
VAKNAAVRKIAALWPFFALLRARVGCLPVRLLWPLLVRLLWPLLVRLLWPLLVRLPVRLMVRLPVRLMVRLLVRLLGLVGAWCVLTGKGGATVHDARPLLAVLP